MLHHAGIRTQAFAAGRTFYASALAPLGIVCFYEARGVASNIIEALVENA